MRKVLLALLIWATSALAADFSGNWSGEGTMNGEPHAVYVVLHQDGANVSGTIGRDATEQRPFDKGKVDGDKLIFDFSPNGNGTIHFELKVDGETLKGTAVFHRDDGDQTATLTLKRVTV